MTSQVEKQQFSHTLKKGDVVLLCNSTGTVRYIGPVHWDLYRKYVGIELSKSVSNGHDGFYQNYRYFTCKDGRGILVPLSNVDRIVTPEELWRKVSWLTEENRILKDKTRMLKDQIKDLHKIQKKTEKEMFDMGTALDHQNQTIEELKTQVKNASRFTNDQSNRSFEDRRNQPTLAKVFEDMPYEHMENYALEPENKFETSSQRSYKTLHSDYMSTFIKPDLHQDFSVKVLKSHVRTPSNVPSYAQMELNSNGSSMKSNVPSKTSFKSQKSNHSRRSTLYEQQTSFSPRQGLNSLPPKESIPYFEPDHAPTSHDYAKQQADSFPSLTSFQSNHSNFSNYSQQSMISEISEYSSNENYRNLGSLTYEEFQNVWPNAMNVPYHKE